ncbi:MAG: MFS transporter [Gammaproteobacteria bacterium]
MRDSHSETPWILSSSRTLRLFTIFILYIAQGIPIGLFWYAIPAWMAANGADARDVAWVLGLTALPWSLKLVNGFLMDRYAFLPMGRRRAWILGAQLIMILVFVSAALIQPAASDILLLGLFGFIGNAATTFQDVGVDSMAVDLLPERERARGGGMMFGGQLIGTALATAGTGWAIMALGASGAYLLAAGAILLVTVYIAAVRERDNERHFPWSAGEAHPVNLERHVGRWGPIFRTTLQSVLLPVSLFWAVTLLIRGAQYGVMAGITPLIGVSEAGLSEAEVTSLTGTAQLVAGVAGLTLGSWLGERLGAKWSSIVLLAAWVLFDGAMMLAEPLWSEAAFAPWFIIAWFALDTLLTVVAIPISMRLCNVTVAATQFTIYMALFNLGITLGTVLLGLSERLGGLVALFPILIAGNLLALAIMLLVPLPRRAVGSG